MSQNSIDQSFVDQFEQDVHLAYQRFSAKLPPTVRRKMNVRGQSTTFQTIGKGMAQRKGRNAQVPIMNLAHQPVKAILEDWYAGEFVDYLDELKIEHDERNAIVRSIAGALGRRSDQIIIDKADTFSNVSSSVLGGIDKFKVDEVYIFMGDGDVPDDGDRYAWVSPQGWTDLTDLDQFSNADYVPTEELPLQARGMTAKRWFSFFWAQHSGLSIQDGTRNSLVYHRSALAHASGHEVSMDITWQGKEQAHLFVGKMSQGAVVIDDNGGFLLKHTEA